ncbi:hypothetical protein Q0Z83_019990 [Actinoplanes sichuanensis]|uniref:DUF7144 domain-containing protein n=1 Tax=Actinoplanes sichuanensis TaxID=512349 RepID=A0ABW4AL70_9ACTN|nr:hypothetical protein [Actinoplanes sichuanensis]BEL03808.1 hypothetical protein Q0Z83_019990 [Actinoplanes sichuanensis]
MPVQHSRATGWTAWVLFGGVMLVLLGTVHLYAGSIGLIRPEVLAGTRSDLLLPVSMTVLGWTHVVFGTIAIVTGVGLIRGRFWARLTAILFAGVSSLVNFTFAPAHPIWSVVALGLAAVVAWAAAAHGDEVADAYGT